MYDSLYPFALKISELWEFAHKTIANITDLGELTIRKVFSKDFKMKSKDELISDLKSARDANADAHIIQAIEDDIARIIYADNPEELKRYFVKQSLYPYSGMSQDQVRDAVAAGMIRKADQVLASNYGHIFDMIDSDISEGKNIDFWQLPKNKQRAIVNEKVIQLMDEIMPSKNLRIQPE